MCLRLLFAFLCVLNSVLHLSFLILLPFASTTKWRLFVTFDIIDGKRTATLLGIRDPH